MHSEADGSGHRQLDITGHYEVGGLGFTIEERAGRLIMVEPDVPAGYEPVLEWTGPAAVRILTGPFAGAEMEFVVESGSVVGGVAGGIIPVSRVEDPPAAVPGAGLQAPGSRRDPDRDRAFTAAWDSRIPGAAVSVPAEYPVHSFVQWLMRHEEFVFHGSTRVEIEEFSPRRESMEIGDSGGHGNLEAVYATHDGLWAMFFAIVDRSRVRGSIRNGVGRYEAEDGTSINLYRFSIEESSLVDRPFCPGALYVLPRAPFERIPLYPGGPPTNEWACFSPVRPAARFMVTPDDFPFLDRIGGHEEAEFLRLAEVGDVVFSHVVAAERIPGGVRVTLDAALAVAIRDEWLELGRRFYPDVVRNVVDATTIELSGPPAFVHGIEARLADILD